MNSNLNEKKDHDGKDKSVISDENIYGMACTPGKKGYNYSPYVGSYEHKNGKNEKKCKKRRMAVLAVPLIIAAALLCAAFIWGLGSLDFFASI